MNSNFDSIQTARRAWSFNSAWRYCTSWSAHTLGESNYSSIGIYVWLNHYLLQVKQHYILHINPVHIFLH